MNVLFSVGIGHVGCGGKKGKKNGGGVKNRKGGTGTCGGVCIKGWFSFNLMP